jgi:hypothetical protein
VIGKYNGKGPLGSPGLRWKNSVKWDFKEV